MVKFKIQRPVSHRMQDLLARRRHFAILNQTAKRLGAKISFAYLSSIDQIPSATELRELSMQWRKQH